MKYLASIFLAVCVISFCITDAGATSFEINTPVFHQAQTDTVPLAKQQVHEYITTRIAAARLQNKMKANAEQYESVVTAYFKKRKELLENRGWTVEKFQSVQQRTYAAITGMDVADKLEKSKAEHEKEIERLKSSKKIPEAKKQQMIKALNHLRNYKREQIIDPNKPDWPAVKPYRKELNTLTAWIAGNIDEPPKM